MQRVLVTGANGFIARALIRSLRVEGRTVLCASREAYGSDFISMGAAPWSARAWSDALDKAEPDTVFHLAGAMGADRDELFAANLGSAEGLFAALRAAPRVRVVLAGSAAEYGAAIEDGVPARETLPCRPLSLYGQSKYAQTQAAAAAIEAGASILIARIFNVIGPGMPRTLAIGDFAGQIARMDPSGGRLVTGNLDVDRDYVSADQLVVALKRLAAADFSGVVNVCSGEAVTIRRLVESLVAASGRQVEIVFDPARARPGELKTIIGSTVLLTELGAAPTPVDISLAAEVLAAAEGP